MIVKRDFIYTPKGKNRPLHIYLPDDYASSTEHYPVMYFLNILAFGNDRAEDKSKDRSSYVWSK